MVTTVDKEDFGSSSFESVCMSLLTSFEPFVTMIIGGTAEKKLSRCPQQHRNPDCCWLFSQSSATATILCKENTEIKGQHKSYSLQQNGIQSVFQSEAIQTTAQDMYLCTYTLLVQAGCGENWQIQFRWPTEECKNWKWWDITGQKQLVAKFPSDPFFRGTIVENRGYMVTH